MTADSLTWHLKVCKGHFRHYNIGTSHGSCLEGPVIIEISWEEETGAGKL